MEDKPTLRAEPAIQPQDNEDSMSSASDTGNIYTSEEDEAASPENHHPVSVSAISLDPSPVIDIEEQKLLSALTRDTKVKSGAYATYRISDKKRVDMRDLDELFAEDSPPSESTKR